MEKMIQALISSKLRYFFARLLLVGIPIERDRCGITRESA